jgi:hypothetical protein
MPLICVWLYSTVFSNPLNNQTIALVTNSSLDCSIDFHLQCLLTKELEMQNIFNLQYFDDMEFGQKLEEFVAIIEFQYTDYFDCSNAYEILSVLEMQSSILIVQLNTNVIMKNAIEIIMIGTYQNVTTQVFRKCKLDGYEKLMTFMDMNDSELTVKFGLLQLQMVITL